MSIDFPALARALLAQAPSLVASWLPGGRVQGREYVCGSLRGNVGDSFKVNLDTGKWADFASTDKGGDLCSLYAAVEGISQGVAARALASRLGLAPDASPAPSKPTDLSKPADLSPEQPPDGQTPPDLRHVKHGAPTATYPYCDSAGRLMFYVARYDGPEGKAFAPWTWRGGKWQARGWPPPRPLYGLELLAAAPDAPVLVVEGEKAAEAARRLLGGAYAVVTWPNGAASVKRADWAPLAGRHVLIWPDADAPGKVAGAAVAEAVLATAASVKVIDPDDQRNGWDAADAEAEGWTYEQTVAWARPRARLVAPPAQVLVRLPNDPPPVAFPIPADAVDGNVPTSLYNLWERYGLTLSMTGSPIMNSDNVLRLLEQHPPFADLLWFDTFHQRHFTRGDGGRPRGWADTDTIRLMIRLQRELGLRRIGKDAVWDAVSDYAERHLRDEPRDWLATLAWDGVPRIDTCFRDRFGAADDAYTRAVSRNFWLGLAARVFLPGCKLDTMVVFEGKQGHFKSTALEVIGGPWYAETGESVTSKDFFLVLSGKLLVEIAELDSISRVEVTRIKQALSCRIDRYRAPYGRTAADHPRRSVLVGTTNEDAYLRDPTGGRRFWPVRIGRIDLEGLAADRDACFAEAAARCETGERWYLVPLPAAEAAQEARRHGDAWEGIIGDWLHGQTPRDMVTMAEVAVEALKLDVARLGYTEQRRIGAALRALGYERKVYRDGERLYRGWERPQLREPGEDDELLDDAATPLDAEIA